MNMEYAVWQFILEMCWFGNVFFSLSQVSISIGIVVATVGFATSISGGNLKHKPQRIKDIQRNQHAVATGTVSAAAPIERDGTQFAYVPEKEDKITGRLTLEDDSGTIDILLDDAVIAMSSDEPPNQIIRQDTTVFVRGFVNEDRVFASTYFTFTKTEDGPAVDTAVEIQRGSFTKNVRTETGFLGFFLLLLLMLFGGYPLYKHYTFWQMPFTETVVETTVYRDSYTLTFDAWPTHINVIEAVYDACPVGETVTKESKSLSAWCGDERQSQSIEYMPFKRQIWENLGSMVLLVFMVLGVLLIRRKKSA